jgi:hypothetical protein
MESHLLSVTAGMKHSTVKIIASDGTHIDYFQRPCAVQRGLNSRFGIRVGEGACACVVEISDGQPFTFGTHYPLPVKLDRLPNSVRIIITDHIMNSPDSDLMDVLTGKSSFQEALASPVKRELKRMTGKYGEQFK